MSVEQNKSIVRRYLEEAVSQGNMSAIEAYVSPHLVFTSPYTPEPINGIEGFKQMIGMLHTAFPDLKIHEEAALGEEDMVATRWFATGTHRGDFMGHKPSGRQFKISGQSIYRVQDGKIVEGWVNDDSLGMLQQLAIIRMPA
ncbi:MAG: ester cyclase [Chloroflexi bacterium]|nr:MAG: ester cyclase [Chloroflexota bacterium]